jgi:A/G-specific adenine glycosylase
MGVDAEALLAWYEPRRRMYPWRRGRLDPYRVLVSEVMLQQTQASRVAPIFERFMARFPSVEALAAASVGDVIQAWSGLGYNRRAVAMSRAARAVVAEHGGRVPSDPSELRRLPGVGPYTASAVASIGFGTAMAALDTNVKRVVARARLGREPSEVAPKQLAAAATNAVSRTRPGDWNQAVMDLGRTLCRPVPRCTECPLRRGCRSRKRLGGHPTGRASHREADRVSEPFEGSSRQLRGRIVEALRRGPMPVEELASRLRQPPHAVRSAIDRLALDGVLAPERDGVAGLAEV